MGTWAETQQNTAATAQNRDIKRTFFFWIYKIQLCKSSDLKNPNTNIIFMVDQIWGGPEFH